VLDAASEPIFSENPAYMNHEQAFVIVRGILKEYDGISVKSKVN
jgi:hypothetical protein